jgi:hypothetical protein
MYHVVHSLTTKKALETKHNNITITSDVEKMSLPNSRDLRHDAITIMFGSEEMLLPD